MMNFPVSQSYEDKQDTSLEITGGNIFLTAKTNVQAFPILNECTVVLFWLPNIRNRSLNSVDLNQ